MNYRKFDYKKDKEAVYRILNEAGWVHDKDKDKYLNEFLPKGDTWVATIDDEPEVMVVTSKGTIKYLDKEIQLGAVTGVVASFIARKQSIAGKLTANKIAMDAMNGAEVETLCIFDQGYYNKLGFGNGHYETVVEFCPAFMNIKRKIGLVKRLTSKDGAVMHQNRLERMLQHGAVTLEEYTTLAEFGEDDKNIGLGFVDENGKLTHHLAFWGKGKESGPIWIKWMAYQNLDQLMDLLALLKSLDDQIHIIEMIEPTEIQMQDFLDKPFLMKNITKGSKYQNGIRSTAFWQHRILDLQKCLEKTHLKCDDFSFNLELDDPIGKYISEEIEWKGISGEYTISLGKNSKAESGFTSGLPTLNASVGAFTRMWFGIMPASTLVFSDGISAPKELLEKLDYAFQIPKPRVNWSY